MTINRTTHTAPPVPIQPEVNSTPPKPEAPPPVKADNVQISDAAKIAVSSAQSADKAIVQEAVETRAETAREASNGDRQAQRLVAKQAAAAYAAAH